MMSLAEISGLLAVWHALWVPALSLGVFAATAMLIVSIFGQTGRVQLSPQREAAIATGHTDRRTVFENQVLGPLLWVLLAIAHRLALPGLKRWLRQTLVASGNVNYYTPEEYLAMSLLVGLLLGAALGMAYMLVWGQFSFIAFLVGLAAGMAMTLYQLRDKAARRVREISKRVPYSLDLIALAMGAGATFTEAVRTVVRERSEDAFNVELRTVLAEIELGTSRRQALVSLADRVPLDTLRSIIASIVQAEELGTPLADVLRGQATLLRLHRSTRAENKAAVASVRMLVPSLLIMMSAVLAVFAPAILRVLRKGLF